MFVLLFHVLVTPQEIRPEHQVVVIAQAQQTIMMLLAIAVFQIIAPTMPLGRPLLANVRMGTI
jgi:hypothetical protein